MAHQCVHCGKVYEAGANEILQGCVCGGKLFFYFKPEQAAKARRGFEKLTADDKKEILQDVRDLTGTEHDDPVVLDLESINILAPGKYQLNLVSLFKKLPVVYKLEEGKYEIDLAAHITKNSQKRKR